MDAGRHVKRMVGHMVQLCIIHLADETTTKKKHVCQTEINRRGDASIARIGTKYGQTNCINDFCQCNQQQSNKNCANLNFFLVFIAKVFELNFSQIVFVLQRVHFKKVHFNKEL